MNFFKIDKINGIFTSEKITTLIINLDLVSIIQIAESKNTKVNQSEILIYNNGNPTPLWITFDLSIPEVQSIYDTLINNLSVKK